MKNYPNYISDNAFNDKEATIDKFITNYSINKENKTITVYYGSGRIEKYEYDEKQEKRLNREIANIFYICYDLIMEHHLYEVKPSGKLKLLSFTVDAYVLSYLFFMIKDANIYQWLHSVLELPKGVEISAAVLTSVLFNIYPYFNLYNTLKELKDDLKKNKIYFDNVELFNKYFDDQGLTAINEIDNKSLNEVKKIAKVLVK